MKRAPLPVIKHPQYPEFRVLLRAHQIRGFIVPRGFVWDGCSIPSAVRWLIGDPYDGPQRDAGLLHDYLYEKWKVQRAIADELFLRQLVDDGASQSKALTMWSAVRLFASGHYGKQSPWPKFVDETQLRRWELTHEVGSLPLFGGEL